MKLVELKDRGDLLEENCNLAVCDGNVGDALRFGVMAGSCKVGAGFAGYVTGMARLDGRQAALGVSEMLDGASLPVLAPLVAFLNRGSNSH